MISFEWICQAVRSYIFGNSSEDFKEFKLNYKFKKRGWS